MIGFGTPIREEKGGEEKVFSCASCGKDKLYLNSKSGVWHCFSCGRSGKSRGSVEYRTNTRTLPLEPTQAEQSSAFLSCHRRRNQSKHREASAPLGAIRGIREDTLIESGCFSPWPGVLALPLLSMGWETVGYQLWTPDPSPGEPKYRVIGQRGVGSLRQPGKWDTETPLLLLEGFFDYLSVSQIVLYQQSELIPVLLCGNCIGESQLDTLTSLFTLRGQRKLFIGFDNDQVSPKLTAKQVLKPYFSVQYWSPPLEYKDWDEYIQKDPKGATHCLR